MKKILIVALVVLVGCSSRFEEENPPAISEASCSVYNSESGVVIECPDGSRATVKHGTAGSHGSDGTNGQTPTSNAPSSLSHYLHCDDTLSDTNLSVYYRLATFEGEYTFVVAGVYGSQIEVNNSLIYPFRHVEYQSSPVYFTYDLAGQPNGGYWRIYYNVDNHSVVVDYIDIDESFSWELTDCILED
jgi:hypothetical protein